MTFQDILKKSFLEGFGSVEVNTTTIFITLAFTALLGLYIYGVYRIVSRKGFYSQSFNISLVALALITAAIILTIQSSVVISLGMVGALSIVRFRTAIKDPMDLVFLFWAISVGIICGAGLFEVALVTSLGTTVIILALSLLPVSRPPMILITNASDCDVEQQVMECVKKHAKYFAVKSRNLTKKGLDMIIELRTKDGGELVKEINAIQAVNKVSLLSHDGDVTY